MGISILVTRENLITGNKSVFDILKNSEFRNRLIDPQGATFRNIERHIYAQLDQWNKQQPKNWRYTIVEVE